MYEYVVYMPSYEWYFIQSATCQQSVNEQTAKGDWSESKIQCNCNADGVDSVKLYHRKELKA